MHCEVCGAQAYEIGICWGCGNHTTAPTDKQGIKYYGGAKPAPDRQADPLANGPPEDKQAG